MGGVVSEVKPVFGSLANRWFCPLLHRNSHRRLHFLQIMKNDRQADRTICSVLHNPVRVGRHTKSCGGRWETDITMYFLYLFHTIIYSVKSIACTRWEGAGKYSLWSCWLAGLVNIHHLLFGVRSTLVLLQWHIKDPSHSATVQVAGYTETCIHPWSNKVGVGWLCRCPGRVWKPIRKQAHTQLVREHLATVV